MRGDIVGPAVGAVLVPPQAERFAALVGVDLDRLVLNVTGWNKLVLLDSERVFLFPRSQTGVEWFERELAVYRALADTCLSVVPRLLGYWDDPEIYPFPFAAVSRLRGAAPAEPEALAEQLGQAIAGWHEIEPPALAGARPPGHHNTAEQRWLRRALDPATSAEAAREAGERLGQPGRASASFFLSNSHSLPLPRTFMWTMANSPFNFSPCNLNLKSPRASCSCADLSPRSS